MPKGLQFPVHFISQDNYGIKLGLFSKMSDKNNIIAVCTLDRKGQQATLIFEIGAY